MDLFGQDSEHQHGDAGANDQPRAAARRRRPKCGPYKRWRADPARVDSEIRRIRERLDQMRIGFRHLEQLEAAGRYVGRRRATLGARFQKEWRKLFDLSQLEFNFEKDRQP